MPEKPTDGGSFDQDRYRNPEAALGGADAVQKTSYVTGSGAEPETMKREGTSAGVPAGGGQNATWIVLGSLLVLAVLVYLLGFGR